MALLMNDNKKTTQAVVLAVPQVLLLAPASAAMTCVQVGSALSLGIPCASATGRASALPSGCCSGVHSLSTWPPSSASLPITSTATKPTAAVPSKSPPPAQLRPGSPPAARPAPAGVPPSSLPPGARRRPEFPAARSSAELAAELAAARLAPANARPLRARDRRSPPRYGRPPPAPAPAAPAPTVAR
eukprot:XP_008666871.2 basic proline-rich protein-like [Zea mays]